ncbi:hypothetical protein BDR03DRAFT_1003491 [Suillus americanus]|nr:hypothetical protein BDR03DRAFT_1003491 [Suillus americanus]
MNQDTNPQFLFLSEDLHAYILTFLSYRDIIRCTSVCKCLRQTYLSSSELQYIVELGGQRLLPVGLGAHNHTPISERLRVLRDKARAWFKFDTRPVQTAIVPESGPPFAKICSILSKPGINREWHCLESLLSVPNARHNDVLIDPEQNLVADAYEIIGKSRAYIDLLALDGDGSHPRAVGPTLSTVPRLPGRQNTILARGSWRLDGLGRHIALWHFLQLDDPYRILWWLQIWDWQHSTTSNCILRDTLFTDRFTIPIDSCFLGNNRLLIASGNLKVYSIEDMSQAPQLLACFLLPCLVEAVRTVRFFPSKDNIVHISQTGMKHTTWASDPSDRVLSLITAFPLTLFVISTSTFFELDFPEEMASAIPWKIWGPSSTRIFECDCGFGVGVGGSRVLRAVPTEQSMDDPDDHTMKYRLHMMDFSPLAVLHRQGLGRVVREPSMIDLGGELVTTSLAYVEVMSSRKSISQNNSKLFWIDNDRIYAFHMYTKSLEVIKI